MHYLIFCDKIILLLIRPLGQAVKTAPSQGAITSSILVGVTMKKDIFGCLFSVIFVPCGTSDIYFVSDIALRAVIFAYGELKEQI